MGDLKPAAAIEFLQSLPRKVRTCETAYSIAICLSREGLVKLEGRTVLGNNQVRYQISLTEAVSACWRLGGAQ